MFNLQPGQGLGSGGWKQIAFGLGEGIVAALLAIARKIFKKEKIILFQHDPIDVFERRDSVEVYSHAERNVFERRPTINNFLYVRKCDERR